MVWRKDVRWSIHQDDDPRKFMTVDSGEYVLAIPDFNRQARDIHPMSPSESDSISSSSSLKNSATFKKVVMKLAGDVRWLAGLMFERDLDSKSRSFDFIPHYNVILKTPQHTSPPPGQVQSMRFSSASKMLISTRFMMLSEVFAAITYTCPLQ